MTPNARPAPPSRIRPWEALRAFAKVVGNPDDTENGARFVLALQGKRNEETFQRFAADPDGARILEERRNLVDRLQDRRWLASLPHDSLGRAYLDFLENEELSAEGLLSVVERADPESLRLDPARLLVHDRIGAMHDLWHVVTGYSRDLVGETLLIYFSYQQLRTRAFALLIPLTYLFNEWRTPGFRVLGRQARRRGREAVWLPVQDWESLLECPLDEVRKTLRVGAPPTYTQVRSDGAPPESQTQTGTGLATAAGPR
jgi:ubiquinone biosynthesis protein COQ4